MTFVDVTVPVLVLRMDHHSVLGVMRSLGRLGVKVYGIHSTAHAVSTHSKYCSGVFVWDLEKSSASDSVAFLVQVARKMGSRPLLLATNDETAFFISENAAGLKNSFVFQDNPPQLVRSLFNKREMYHLAKRLSIPIAETNFPLSRQDVVDYCDNAQFPVMLKASDNITCSRRNGIKMVVARSSDELIRHYDAMEDLENPTLMLQEYIPGREGNVWMFNGYFDEDSNCRFGVTGKRIRQTPAYCGMTALGVCAPNPTVEEMTNQLAKAVHFKGILDADYIFDTRSGVYKLLDVNPRLGASFRLFCEADGMDVVRSAYLHVTGQKVPTCAPAYGRKWMVFDADIVSCVQYYRDRVLTLKEWIESYRGVGEDAWFASDDMGPFLRICGRFMLRPFRMLLQVVSARICRIYKSKVESRRRFRDGDETLPV